jgi:hypothetical protein
MWVGTCRAVTKRTYFETDLIAMKRNDEALGVGDCRNFCETPAKQGNRAMIRRQTLAVVRSLYAFPLETKPAWKFRFLDSPQAHRLIFDQWEIPDDFDSQQKMQVEVVLPAHWDCQVYDSTDNTCF